jgi:hypothetical protein
MRSHDRCWGSGPQGYSPGICSTLYRGQILWTTGDVRLVDYVPEGGTRLVDTVRDVLLVLLDRAWNEDERVVVAARSIPPGVSGVVTRR